MIIKPGVRFEYGSVTVEVEGQYSPESNPFAGQDGFRVWALTLAGQRDFPIALNRKTVEFFLSK